MSSSGRAEARLSCGGRGCERSVVSRPDWVPGGLDASLLDPRSRESIQNMGTHTVYTCIYTYIDTHKRIHILTTQTCIYTQTQSYTYTQTKTYTTIKDIHTNNKLTWVSVCAFFYGVYQWWFCLLNINRSNFDISCLVLAVLIQAMVQWDHQLPLSDSPRRLPEPASETRAKLINNSTQVSWKTKTSLRATH